MIQLRGLPDQNAASDRTLALLMSEQFEPWLQGKADGRCSFAPGHEWITRNAGRCHRA